MFQHAAPPRSTPWWRCATSEATSTRGTMNGLLQHLRYPLRQLGKNPGFTQAAVLTLAIGIGPNTAIYSVIEALLLRQLPFGTPDRLGRLTGQFPPTDP